MPKGLILLLLCVLSLNLSAAAVSVQSKANASTVQVELFLSSTCSHCKKADAFFEQIEKKAPWLSVSRHVIDTDKSALVTFREKLIQQNTPDDYAVPAIFFCGSKWTGFATEQSTGAALWKALSFCHQQLEKEHELTPMTTDVIQRWVPGDFQVPALSRTSIYSSIISMAIFDAFNPCSFFAISLILAILFVYPSMRDKFNLGLLMILFVSIVHYVQQVQANVYYQLLSWLRWPSFFIGLLLLSFVFFRYKFKSAVYGYLLVLLSLALVLLYQQTCISTNISLVFEQWLNAQQLTLNQQLFAQILYQITYIVPLLLIWLFSLYYLSERRGMAWRSQVESIGELFLMAISFILMAYPRILTNMYAALLVMIPLAIFGWIRGGLRKGQGD